MLIAFIFSDVHDHELAVFEYLIAVLLNRIELDTLPFRQDLGFLGKRDAQHPFQDPANFMVVVVDLRLGNTRSTLRFSKQAVGIRIPYLLECESFR